jgi:DNA polymerase III delta subunit
MFSTIIQPGLFAEREAIVIEGIESLGAFPENLASLIEDDKADTQIILVLSGDAKPLKAIAQSITLIKPEAQVPPWKRQEWLMNLAKSAKVKIASEAAQLLSDSIESQEELRGELRKLAFYADGREIVRADVEALSFDEGGRSMMMFVDGICDNKPHDVARAIRHLRGDSILPPLSAITNRLRPALILASFPEKVQADALKATDNDPVKKKYAVVKAKSALKHFGAERVKRFMLKAIRLSFLEKTNRAEGWEGFEAIIWELMAKV